MQVSSNAGDSARSPAATEQQMTTVSTHHFGSADENADAFSITVIESMKEDYGLFVWPCSVVLAEYIWQQRLRFSGVSVVELGAGTSLPGLVAAKVGADVTLTDDANGPEVLSNMKRVSVLNNLDCKVIGLTWGVWDQTIFSLSPRIVLGADVLYDTSGMNKLIAIRVLFLHFLSPIPKTWSKKSEMRMLFLHASVSF